MDPIKTMEGRKFTTKVMSAGEERSQEFTVLASCGENTPYGRWMCITHNQVFRNQFEKDGHLHAKRGAIKPCELCWICPKHGPEVP